MSRSLRSNPQTLPALFALAWLCAQTLLAWHAPSHITASASHIGTKAIAEAVSSSADKPHADALATTVNAGQDCQLGVNGHGIAAVTAITFIECRPTLPTALYTQSATHTYTSAQFTDARAPPASA